MTVSPEVERLLIEKAGIRLDIGCGSHKQAPDWVGMDAQELPGVDIVWDVENIPWPLPDECAVVMIASHLVEHINPVKGGMLKFMNEAWRVLRVDCQFALSYPHGSSQGFLQDPTHVHSMNERVWAYFDPLEPNTGGALYRLYRPKPWKIESLSWDPSASVEVVLRKRLEDRSYYE